MPRPSSRDRILDAAETVAVQLGAAHLTLEAVAAQAKVSKGGLLYHFKDKDAMLAAMMQRYLSRCIDKRGQQCARMGGDTRALVKANILQTCDDKTLPLRLHHTLTAVAANDPRVMEPVRTLVREDLDMYGETFARPEKALLLMVAAKGLRFMDLIHLNVFTAAERQAVVNLMLEMADALEERGHAPKLTSKAAPLKKTAPKTQPPFIRKAN